MTKVEAECDSGISRSPYSSQMRTDAEYPVGFALLMDSRRQRAEKIAKRYIGVDTLMKDLGSGAEGFVFPSPSATAVKVFTYKEKFARELAAYKRLRRHKVDSVLGFAVPKLLKWNSRLLVIEMTLVEPPFLLDFAQAELDTPLEFPEGLEEWWGRLAEDFGERLPVVQSVFFELQQKYGIYYYDLAPRNINFGDDK